MAVEVPPGGTRGAKGTPSGPTGRIFMGIARAVHRLTGSKMGGRPLLYLSTVGAKSGQRRTSVVMPFPDGADAWLIVASKGGAATHPSWFYNLAAHPDQVEVEVDGRKTAVTPQTLTGEQRAAAWQRITSERPNFASYGPRRTASSRGAADRALNPAKREVSGSPLVAQIAFQWSRSDGRPPATSHDWPACPAL